MAEEPDQVEQILGDLGIQRDDTDSTEDSDEEAETVPVDDEESDDRLEQLYEAGALTDEEYEVLKSHLSENDDTGSSSSSEPVEFGKPIATSEGTDMDFSIVGVIEDVDTTNLTHEYGEDGGPERTLVFW